MLMSNICGIHHASFLVADIENALQFYRDVLGLICDETRPDLGYPGVWLKIGDNQQLHLMQLPNPDVMHLRPDHGGRDRHVAFTIRNLPPLEKALQDAGIEYTMSKSGRQALFCRDYDANALEFIVVKRCIFQVELLEES